MRGKRGGIAWLVEGGAWLLRWSTKMLCNFLALGRGCKGPGRAQIFVYSNWHDGIFRGGKKYSVGEEGKELVALG